VFVHARRADCSIALIRVSSAQAASAAAAAANAKNEEAAAVAKGEDKAKRVPVLAGKELKSAERQESTGSNANEAVVLEARSEEKQLGAERREEERNEQERLEVEQREEERRKQEQQESLQRDEVKREEQRREAEAKEKARREDQRQQSAVIAEARRKNEERAQEQSLQLGALECLKQMYFTTCKKTCANAETRVFQTPECRSKKNRRSEGGKV
jgi:colicin import membrane protein